MRTLSIRWRLTLSYGIATALLLIGVASTVYLMLQQRLIARTDIVLAEECNELSLEVRLAGNIAELKEQLTNRFAEHETFDFQVFQMPSGELVFRSARLQDIPASKRPGPEFDSAFSNFTFASGELGECRVATGHVFAFQQQFLYQVFAPLADNASELADFASVFWVVGPLGVLGAVGIGYWLARRALAPVDQMIATARRITASRRDDRLVPQNPDDELGRLAGTLNGMIDRLDAAVSDQQKFTADAAHELRTPLAILKTEVEVARRHPRSSHEYQETLDVILAEIDRLTRLTNGLLMLSRQDAGLDNVVRDPVELTALLEDVVEQLRGTAESRQIRLHLDATEDARVLGDDLQLSRLFFNVMENAIKYSGEGSDVHAVVTTTDDWAIVTIEDAGLGIPPDHLPHLFKRFYRVDVSRSHRPGGSGLGLAISMSIAESHGGTIEIASTPGKGTKVLVRLPRSSRQD